MKQIKRIVAILLCAMIAISVIGCSSNDGGSDENKDASENQGTVSDDGEEPGVDGDAEAGLPDQATFEELLAAGKENGNKLTIYSTHSVTVSAVEAFANKFDIDIELVEGTQIGDNDQITQVAAEVGADVAGADIIFIQDGARTLTDLVEEGYVYNWYNQEIYDVVGEDCEPLLVWDYCNKVFIYNSDNVAAEDLTNIWYATDPEYYGTLQMKDPEKEGVNMNFLVMLTSDEYSAILEEAYEAYYGEALVLDPDCVNAGYQWIKMAYQNGLLLGSSDGDIAQAIGAEGQSEKWSALITLNKYKKNLDVGYKLGYVEEMEPVAGFIYPIYGLLTSNADNPELAKAFLVWLYTEDGWFGDGETVQRDGSVYVGMTGRFGDYSGNQSLEVVEGDKNVQEWKTLLIQEDPEFCAANRADVEDFIKTIK